MSSSLIPASAKPFAKRLLITGALEALAWTRLDRVFPAAAGRGVVFTLHHVRPATNRPFEPNAMLSVTPEFLDRAMAEAKRRGYEAVPLDALPDILAAPDTGRRVFAVTLDDGCRDNALHAAPVFRRHGVPYTLFLTKGFALRTRTMWWETAEALTRVADALSFDFGHGPEAVPCRTLAEKRGAFLRLAHFVDTFDENTAVARIDAAAREAGIDPLAIVEREIMSVDEIRALAAGDPLAHFGAHTVTHCNLARVPPDRLAAELAESADAVEDWAGRRPTTLAYPYGWVRAAGPREAQAAEKAGFRVAVTTQPGVVGRADGERLTLLPRVSLNGLFQQPRYVGALMSGLPFRLMKQNLQGRGGAAPDARTTAVGNPPDRRDGGQPPRATSRRSAKAPKIVANR